MVQASNAHKSLGYSLIYGWLVTLCEIKVMDQRLVFLNYQASVKAPSKVGKYKLL